MNQIDLLGQSLGRQKASFNRPQRQSLDPNTLVNYMPMGRSRAIYQHSPEELRQGVNAMKMMMQERTANMMKEQHMADIANQIAKNKAIIAARQKLDWMKSTPESRTLARIQKFMIDRGKSMGNSFHF